MPYIIFFLHLTTDFQSCLPKLLFTHYTNGCNTLFLLNIYTSFWFFKPSQKTSTNKAKDVP